jgi:hypothetical protein
MDIVGKFPKAPGGNIFMLAMPDYFSKWIKASKSETKKWYPSSNAIS